MSLRDKVLVWLAEEGLETRIENVPPGVPVEWAVSAFLPGPIRIGVIIQQPKDRKDIIMLTLGVMVGSEHRDGLMKLGVGERVQIAHDMLKSLLYLCPDCSIFMQPSLEDLQYINVSKIHYVNSLTREDLMYSVRVLGNTFILIVSELNTSLTVKGVLKKRDGEGISI
ncbi:MAG: DUF2299 family protein [Acidilobaceae archaeon]|nr:DUF2299 family protein [Acidilobaceae archaeon]MCX8165065.1 DUF2299 family protein [Acidilobaceae archaeon]MDW7974418.1 DUF2299 family protein [Sulfolobales archaeon]